MGKHHSGAVSDPGEKFCRFCQSTLFQEDRMTIELGCSCEKDFNITHFDCAQQWLDMKLLDMKPIGETYGICELCGGVAKNLLEDRTAAATYSPSTTSERIVICSQNRFRFLSVCLFIGFIIMVVVHYSVP